MKRPNPWIALAGFMVATSASPEIVAHVICAGGVARHREQGER